MPERDDRLGSGKCLKTENLTRTTSHTVGRSAGRQTAQSPLGRIRGRSGARNSRWAQGLGQATQAKACNSQKAQATNLEKLATNYIAKVLTTASQSGIIHYKADYRE